MKIKYWEGENGMEITLTPETPKEVAELARVAMNRKAVPVEISLYMDNEPSATIWIKKVERSSQKTTIRKGA